MENDMSKQSLVEKYSYSKCPNLYKDLVAEARELYSSSHYCMILAAQRLQIIKDKKMYEIEYKTFEEFLDKEIKQHRATVYKYLKFNEVFSNELEHEEDITNLQPTKIFSALPLLTSKKIDDEKKQALKSEFFEYTKKPETSQKEVKLRVKEKANAYGLSRKTEVKKVDPIQKKIAKADDGLKNLIAQITSLSGRDFKMVKNLLSNSSQNKLSKLLEESNQ